MKDNQLWEFTCKTCGSKSLTVIHVWNILAGPATESWQEWGPLDTDHLWRFIYKEKIDGNQDEDDDEDEEEVERGDFGEFAEDDSDSEPEEYETFEHESDPESDEFYVSCTNCDREIEFGWAQPNRGGGIFPAECSDFLPQKVWPDPKYLESWQQKGWLQKGDRHV